LALGKTRTRDDYLALAHLSDAVARRPSADPPDWTDSDTAELNALLAEYASLRQEWSCPGSVDGDGLAGQAAARCFFS
jgi:hypothetical protein